MRILRINKIKNYSEGVTLIELIVAIGLFGVAATIITGTVLSMLVVQDKAIAIRAAMDNLGFAMEIASKDIRTGSGYSSSGSTFSFTSAYDIANAAGDLCPPSGIPGCPDGTRDTISYRVTGGQFQKGINGKFTPLTAPEIIVDSIYFNVTGETNMDDWQPMVTIVLGAMAGKKSETKINLQTTVSQRKIDY